MTTQYNRFGAPAPVDTSSAADSVTPQDLDRCGLSEVERVPNDGVGGGGKRVARGNPMMPSTHNGGPSSNRGKGKAK